MGALMCPKQRRPGRRRQAQRGNHSGANGRSHAGANAFAIAPWPGWNDYGAVLRWVIREHGRVGKWQDATRRKRRIGESEATEAIIMSSSTIQFLDRFSERSERRAQRSRPSLFQNPKMGDRLGTKNKEVIMKALRQLAIAAIASAALVMGTPANAHGHGGGYSSHGGGHSYGGGGHYYGGGGHY